LTVVLGVDPGVTGALAWLDTNGRLEITDMPTVELITSAGGKRRYVNPGPLIEHLQFYRATDAVYLERQWGQKGDGTIQAFGIGDAFGCVRTAVMATHLSYHLVAPGTWKRWVQCPPKKKGGLQRARELFPAYADLFKREKDNGRADAALIALYGLAQLGKVKLKWNVERAAAR